MCTFEHERSVVVCDLAISQVRHELEATFGQRVRYAVVEGKGTRVQADATIAAQQFSALVRDAIEAAQEIDEPETRREDAGDATGIT